MTTIREVGWQAVHEESLGSQWSLNLYFDFDELEKSNKPLQSSSFLCKMGI